MHFGPADIECLNLKFELNRILYRTSESFGEIIAPNLKLLVMIPTPRILVLLLFTKIDYQLPLARLVHKFA